jgi:hypothetical protein
MDDNGIVDRSQIIKRGENEWEHITELHQYQIPVLEENFLNKLKNPSNGFSEGRMLRKVASIPLVGVLEAERLGFDLGNKKDLERFLDFHPEYLSVRKIDTGSTGKIIIK